MPGDMILKIWDVQHGACAMLTHRSVYGVEGCLAMIDSGDNGLTRWKPSTYIKHYLNRSVLDYLFVTNADLDHISDLNNLWREGITVSTFFRNRSVSPAALRIIKEASGELTEDIKQYLALHASYIYAVDAPFDENMGGVTATTFYNAYPRFYDTNNLSMVVFFKFGAFKILFPGDLEEDGWLALLEQPTFRDELVDTTVLYRQRVIEHWPNSVLVATTGKQRHVLTTRRDGWIQFNVSDRGDFTIYTECYG